ncbi:hypothetical protein D3C85_1346910 [compost metagenome]
MNRAPMDCSSGQTWPKARISSPAGEKFQKPATRKDRKALKPVLILPQRSPKKALIVPQFL